MQFPPNITERQGRQLAAARLALRVRFMPAEVEHLCRIPFAAMSDEQLEHFTGAYQRQYEAEQCQTLSLI